MTGNELKYFSKLRLKKYRDQENKFLIEGDHLVAECVRSKFYSSNLTNIFIREDYSNESLLDKIQIKRPDIEITSLSERQFNQLTETVNPQGIIGVVLKSAKNSRTLNGESKLITALDNVNDPGNLGTIIRTCHWFGLDELIIGTESVEIFNPKVIRASQGSLFHFEIHDNIELTKELKLYFENGYKIILADLNSKLCLDELSIDSNKKYLIVFGNEAKGIRDEISGNKNYDKIKIRGFSDCESLNLSVSAGIFLNAFSMNKITDSIHQ